MDWLVVSGFIGLILPLIIERFANKAKGQAKILIVFGWCILAAVVQTGVQGGWIGWNWSMLAQSVLMILGTSVVLWREMWRKWYPNTPDPVDKAK